MWFYPLLSFIVLFFLQNSVDALNSTNNNTLLLTHVIFRHGNCTPSQSGLWKTNKYYNESYYEPYGYGQLTNNGKMTAYQLGVTLRNRYREFLNTTWNMKICEAWTSDYDWTKMSNSLVLGGLFPAEDPVSWHKTIAWQPIPFHYLPVGQDKELSSWMCPTTVPLIYADTSNMKKLKSYDGLIKTLSENTGEQVDYISALDLYFGMYSQEELGFPLDDWTKSVYPEPLKSFVVDFYYIETSTKELKTVLAGYILKKILADTINKINGTLEARERKLFLYSGLEVNIATIMAALEVYKLKDPPPYASYLVFEVHNIDGVHGIKMFYEDYMGTEPHSLILPGCQTFCPLNDFIRLTAPIMPKSDNECYGN